MDRKSYISHENGEYCVRSENNPDWSGGCYKSRAEAEDRLAQVERIKHMKGSPDQTPAEYVAEAMGRITRGDKDGASWTFHQSMGNADRERFDQWLIETRHPSADQAGTTESRFKNYVNEALSKESKKGGAMNREGGLPKTKRELKNYYCPECGEDSEIVFEPTPFISEITPYVCVSCGKNVIPVDRRTDKQIDVWKYWQHGKEKEGAVKDLIARIDRVIKLGAAERVFAADEPEEEEEEQAEEGEEVLIETEEDAEAIYEEAKEEAIGLLDRIIEFCIKEAGNPPAWVKNPAIWEKAKEAVEPYKKKQENYYATVAYIYEKMGGGIKKK